MSELTRQTPQPEADPLVYWAGIADYLFDEGQTINAYASRVYETLDRRLAEIPPRYFDKRGQIGPAPMEVHAALGELLAKPPDNSIDDQIFELFPTWKAQVDYVLSYMERG
jgi:hypothetical protein